ncbi:MAG: TonB-dependent receptor plug domain-containing protein [Deltaproteobacteria bacterium]|nr:TonB-dependent receptor plug domain-containing protein [Deltaproteobacteria bacterium]
MNNTTFALGVGASPARRPGAWSMAAALLLSVSILSTSTRAVAEESENNLIGKSLDELMEMEVSVTSKSKLSIREAPGIVSVLTRDQIENSGAWDLLELLRLLPGIQFGVDVQGVTGISVRGLWGHEGKVLLIWNGHEMNELAYSTTQFGGHFPIDEIERIEVIRGPGSVLYGGFAELAVINIVTRDAESLNGGYASGALGQTADTSSRRYANLAAGQKVGDLSIKSSAFEGRSVRGDGDYTDVFGTQFPLDENNTMKPSMYSVDLGYKGFEARFLADRYFTHHRDGYVEALSDQVSTSFDSYHGLLQYQTNPSEALTLNARMTYKRQTPWEEDSLPTGENSSYDRTIERYRSQVSGEYRVDDIWSGLFGVDYTFDRATDNLGTAFSNGRDSVSYWNYAPFTEIEGRFDWAVVRAGVRYDEHEQFGSNVVPRLAITKSYEQWNFKLLASSAYRTPGIENINRNESAIESGFPVDEIEAEQTTVYELETGYKLTDSTYASLNLFNMQIEKPITYFFDDATELEGYQNAGQIGTQGAELSFQWLNNWGRVDLTYSFFTKSNTDADTFEVPGHSSTLLGFAQHKFTGLANIKLSEQLAFNPSFTVLGDRYGFSRVDSEGNLVLERFDPSFLINTAIGYRPESFTRLRIDLGISNLLNEDQPFLQPYANSHAPLGGLGREYWLKATLQF